MILDEKINIVHNLGYEFIDNPCDITNWSNINIFDTDGYKYKTSLNNLKRNKIPTKIYKKNVYLEDNLKNYFRLNAPECEFKSIDLNDNEHEVKFVCKNHLNKGIQSISLKVFQQKKIRKTNTLCYHCGKRVAGSKLSVSDEVIINRCKELDIKFVGKERSKNNGNLIILFICNKHRNIGIQKRQWDDIRTAKYSCYYCNPLHERTHMEFLTELKKKNYLDMYDVIGTYVNDSNKIKCKCKKCEYEWNSNPKDLKHGTGCPICKQSHGEECINRWLKQNNIYYFREYRFSDCIYKRTLPFDFYLPDYNLCIEYQGEQHYRPVTFNGCSKVIAKNKFEMQKIKDKIKKEYCINNGISFLEISYKEFNHLEKILESKILKYNIA